VAKPLDLAAIRKIALSFPGVEEGTSYGTPAFRVAGKFLARMHQDGESFVLRMDFDTRDFLTRTNPDVFYFTDHYRDYPAVLVRLSTVTRAVLREHFEDAWRGSAPKRVLAQYNKS
jgi:hypothetical protein